MPPCRPPAPSSSRRSAISPPCILNVQQAISGKSLICSAFGSSPQGKPGTPAFLQQTIYLPIYLHTYYINVPTQIQLSRTAYFSPC